LEILLQDLGVTTPRLWRKTPRPWSSNSKTLEKKLQNLGEKTPSDWELEKEKTPRTWSLTPQKPWS
jgi:hypothetical protein